MAKAELHLGLHGPSAPKEISPFFPFCCCIIIVILLCPRPRDESFPTDPHLDIKVLNSVKKKKESHTQTRQVSFNLLWTVVYFFAQFNLNLILWFTCLLEQGQNNDHRNSSEELTVRERQLQIQLEDLRDKLRQQHETFADDKRQLVSSSRFRFSLHLTRANNNTTILNGV